MELARSVISKDGAQYRQLLGSGHAAPDARIDLAFTAEAASVEGSRPEGTLEEITEYYRSLRPGRLVITGTPAQGREGEADADAGTGKTVLALALLLGLASGRAPGEQVPLRLSAASWPGSSGSRRFGVRDWLKGELTDTYKLTARDAAVLIDADLVLPVVDGLDEMDGEATPGYGSRAAELLGRIREFERAGAHCPVVVTCRRVPYEALGDAGVQPNVVAQVALARVDAARARHYLERRVAATELGRERWGPVLAALSAAAAGQHGVLPSAAALAATLDTPWRLTLAATVFEERTPDGGYLRDPAQLLALCADGRLYEYLLDRYIGAAVHAPHRPGGTATAACGSDSRDLGTEKTWRRLAVLARYLDGNASTADGLLRTVKGRVLSGTDLVLHDLWPLAGTRRVRLVERVLGALLALPMALVLRKWPTAFEGIALLTGWLVLVLAVAFRPTWPRPQRFDFRRVRTRAGLGKLALGVTVGLTWGSLFGNWTDWSDLDDPANTVIGLLLGCITGGAFAVMTGQERSGAEVGVIPRDPVRSDFLAGLWIMLAITSVSMAVGATEVIQAKSPFETRHPATYWEYWEEYPGGFKIGFLFGDSPNPSTPGELAGHFTGMTLALGLALSLLVFAFPFKGGSAALRYFAFLLCTRRRLPWRLGRFLDDCYQRGILRIAGTAWQFRHRELQEHLAVTPIPPQRH